MNAHDRQRIIARYNDRLARYGDDIRTLASGTEDRRRMRFDVLCDVGIRTGCTVVDVGCGFGDFFRHLVDRGLTVDYTGIDINPELIAIARQKHPEASFLVADALSDELPMADFIVSTSAFNLKLVEQDNYSLVADVLRACYRHARDGVAIDLLSSYVDFESPEGFHYSPERVFALAKQITKRVSLRHDYPLFEFCLYLYPDFEGWNRDR
jgi:ubiquinone/menaquinone biosynthesis C-methylase UbiE